MKRIPPHIAWPATIIGLLLLGMVWSFGVVAASLVDGGAQVVDNYYARAITWDKDAEVRKKSDALMWDISIELISSDDRESPHAVNISIQDRHGEPVSDLVGTVRVFRPHQADVVTAPELTPVPGTPGVYNQPLPMAGPGLWDFDIDAYRDTLHFVKKVRTEFVM